MATWSERWAEDARSCPSMPAEGGCRGLAQVGTASGSAAKAWKLPRRGRATLRGKPRRARGVPRAAAPTLFASEGGGSPGANGETLRPLSSLPPTPPFVIIPFLGQEVLPQ